MLLEALVACAGVTLKSVATAIGLPLKAGNVIAEGDLDFRGTLGVAKDTPVGFAEIRLRFEVATDAGATVPPPDDFGVTTTDTPSTGPSASAMILAP